MPKVEWKSAAIGAALLYGFFWYRAKMAKTSTTATT
ncbi:hypothetical protein GGD70_003825 [Paraburkholderia fungorum]|nr:hypothetical protein [Paraburkholderia fungorum]